MDLCPLSDSELIKRYPLPNSEPLEELLHAQAEYEKEFPLHHVQSFEEFTRDSKLTELWNEFELGVLTRKRKGKNVKVNTFRKITQYINKNF